jgi:hypothetical protein
MFADEPVAAGVMPAFGAQAPVETRPRRRLESLQQAREPMPPRALQGQLPTFEHAYLMRELRTIGAISTGLLGLLIVLTIVFR